MLLGAKGMSQFVRNSYAHLFLKFSNVFFLFEFLAVIPYVSVLGDSYNFYNWLKCFPY